MTPIDPASLPSMTKQQTPKTMSSRLMTMKFMQRGAAAAAAAAPEASSPATPKSEDGSSKRRKFSHTPSSSASTPATLLYDQKAIHEALEEEEKKRLAAVEKRATELGDSYWVLPGVSAKPKSGTHKPLNVVQIGFAQIDYSGTTADDNPFEESSAPPQTQFRRFNMKKSKPEKKDDEDDSEDSSASDSDDNSDSDDSSEETKLAGSASRGQARGRRDTNDSAANKRTRSNVNFSNKREEERKKAQQLAGKRRQKEIKLSQLSSISSVGSQAFQQQPASGITCYRCGKVGHRAADCSKKR